MEDRIQKLDHATASKIAAGEVIEKPAMVVKELVENAIDAKATEIIIDVKKGGKARIRVTDNGVGINYDDVHLVFERHATSKIKSIEDLYRTRTLGFRGEALASVCAVSHIELITMRASDAYGLKIDAAGGKILKKSEVGAVVGTSITVKDLFFNTPARLKFLKSDVAEGRYITELMNHLALSHPEIAFKYSLEGKMIFHTPGKGDVKDAIFSIYEKDILKHLFKIEEALGEIKLKGYVSKFDYTKGTKSHQIIFVNGRYVKSEWIKDVIQMAYKPHLMQNRYPVCFLFFTMPPEVLDVNIHPAKTEVKFHDEGQVKQVLYTALKKSFNLYDHTPKVTFTEKEVFVQKKEPIISQPYTAPIKPDTKPDLKRYEPQQVDFDAIRELNTFAETFKDEPEILDATSVYDALNYIGVFEKTYLIFEKNSELILIDQHAAHEKVLYERFMSAYKNHDILSQHLLIPETISLSRSMCDTLSYRHDFLKKLGFEYDAFGEQTVVIRAIPSLFNLTSAKEMFLEVLEGQEQPHAAHLEERLASKACKAAVKANDQLETIEVTQLIEDLKALDSPYTCPHGRPIVISFSKAEVERKFKRIL